ncbi:GTP-binding elongation factor [Buchnera aphidicola (Cinara tujafilina)]|uniref:Elongation factor 4 n=1 Tax=Buchnera aphidicola (Cinara tujafilina) TaxID=261317 RepID=F7WZ98_9GAMM|nr:translation elongation factor 4 [Buchnera aphidicola]AEH39755.1 GTP-binding elongation factor [Buchnera aphidicola (Cinara tujafilina)]
MKNIRNFSIIAHVDHGKSTLSDRLIQICGGLSLREMSSQVLDSMDLERERGITIKAQSVMIKYKAKIKTYFLNFIDTPGHVNFSDEVSRSLSACEGALLIVDAAQGVEAQTVANCRNALNLNLKVLPVLNKIDLPNANPEKVSQDIENIIGISMKNSVKCSAKTGFGILELLEQIIKKIPSPSGDINNPLQALVIDSWFDKYLGVVFLIRIKNGYIKIKDRIQVINKKITYQVEKLGILPQKENKKTLLCGEVGWIICGIKNISSIIVGETITSYIKPAQKSLPKFKKLNQKFTLDFFPTHPDQYSYFKDALMKLQLNDTALYYEPDMSKILGLGFRCGFLGLLHLEIIQSRLEREYNISLIVTAPTVGYEIISINGKKVYIDNPSKLPNMNNIKKIREPIAKCNIITPIKYIGNIIKLCVENRGKQKSLVYHQTQIMISYDIPLSELVLNFFDRLKAISSGYASLEYTFKKFKTSKLMKIDIFINSVKIDSLSTVTHKNNVIHIAKLIIKNIKKFMPRHQFDIPIQAKISNTVIARETIKQLRKNVISKCYGGDVSRKKKLLQKQKRGKKKMKNFGSVSIPPEIFSSIIAINKK